MRFEEVFQRRALPIGIEIGASGVRLFQARRVSGGLEAVAAARIELPTPAGEPCGEEHVRLICAAVGSRVAAGSFRGRACVVSVDDRMVRVRAARYPRMPEEELARAVALDAPSRLGFSESDSAEIGWIPAGEVRQGEAYRDEVILIGARREPLERLVLGLAATGLRPEAVEPGFCGVARAFSRSLRRTADQSKVQVLIDVGLRSTGVTIARGQTVAFHKPLELGGEAMTNAAAARLGLPPEAILDLRRRRMLAASGTGVEPIEPRVDRAIFEAVRPTMMDIANEVSLCLRYFGVSFLGSKPDGCYLVGGEAAEPQFGELMGSVIGHTTCVGHPLEGIDLAALGTQITPQTDSAWAVAAGLSLRGQRVLKSAPSVRRRSDDAGSNPSGAAAGDPSTPASSPARRAA